MELLFTFTLLAVAFIGYIMIPLMKLLGLIMMVGGIIFTFCAIIFLFHTPGFALLFLILVIMAIKSNKPNRTSFI